MVFELVGQYNDFVVAELYRSTADNQDGLPIRGFPETILKALGYLEMPCNSDLSGLQQGNDGRVVLQHLEFPVDAGHGYRGYLSREKGGFRRNNF